MRTKNNAGIVSTIDRQIRELIRRRKQVAALEIRKQRFEARVERLQAKIDSILGGEVAAPAAASYVAHAAPRAGGSKRSPRGALTASIAKVLTKSGKALSVGEITAKLEAMGVKTAAKNLSKNVSNTLYTNKRFRRAERGRFTVA
jgi:hypothetical protein